MSISEELQGAVKIAICVGQHVIVRTAAGEYVTEGHVEDVDVDRGLVRIRQSDGGTDVQVDVDTSRYTLWLKPYTSTELQIPNPSVTRAT